MKKVLIAIFIISVSLMAQAGDGLVTGDFLFKNLQGNSHQQAYARSYVIGAAESYYIYGTMLCSPKGISTHRQFRRLMGDTVLRYLQRNPELRRAPARDVVHRALLTKFRCRR